MERQGEPGCNRALIEAKMEEWLCSVGCSIKLCPIRQNTASFGFIHRHSASNGGILGFASINIKGEFLGNSEGEIIHGGLI